MDKKKLTILLAVLLFVLFSPPLIISMVEMKRFSDYLQGFNSSFVKCQNNVVQVCNLNLKVLNCGDNYFYYNCLTKEIYSHRPTIKIVYPLLFAIAIIGVSFYPLLLIIWNL